MVPYKSYEDFTRSSSSTSQQRRLRHSSSQPCFVSCTFYTPICVPVSSKECKELLKASWGGGMYIYVPIGLPYDQDHLNSFEWSILWLPELVFQKLRVLPSTQNPGSSWMLLSLWAMASQWHEGWHQHKPHTIPSLSGCHALFLYLDLCQQNGWHRSSVTQWQSGSILRIFFHTSSWLSDHTPSLDAAHSVSISTVVLAPMVGDRIGQQF